MIKAESRLLSAPRIFIWRASNSRKKAHGLTVKRTKAVTSQRMCFKFLIALSSVLLLFSLHLRGGLA
jgi:hypothetical protein